jgi:hypothetical protein
MKPSGRIVVIDMIPETSPHRDQPSLVVSPAQVEGWMKAAGFSKTRRVEFSAPDKYFLESQR